MTRAFEVFEDLASLAREAARRIQANIELTDPSRRFSLALSGGSTPIALYKEMSGHQHWSRILNDRCSLFFSDERCVPPDHPDSNYKTANDYLFSPLAVNNSHIFRVHGENEPKKAAADYAQCLKSLHHNNSMPQLDLILLGIGNDGHTASLFPGYDFENETDIVVAPYVESKQSYRVSMSMKLINSARQVMVLVSGSDKATTIGKISGGDSTDLPAARLSPNNTLWLLDKAAASLISVKAGE